MAALLQVAHRTAVVGNREEVVAAVAREVRTAARHSGVADVESHPGSQFG